MRPVSVPVCAVMFAAGAASGALGAMALLGWLLGDMALVRLKPSFVPMLPEPALALLLGGAGLTAAAAGRNRAAAACGWTAAAVALSSLFLPPWAGAGVPEPLRREPLSALALSLAGVLVAGPARLARGPWTLLAGAALAGLGGAACLGYAGGFAAAFGWDYATRLPVQAAAGVAALGAGLLACGLEAETGRAAGRWLPAAAGAGTAAAALLLWWALRAEQRERILWTVEAEAASVRLNLQEEIDARVSLLGRLARRSPPEGTGTPALSGGWRGLAWIDGAGRVRWLQTPGELPLEPLAPGLGTGAGSAGRPIELAGGGRGFLLCEPMSGAAGGTICGLLDIAALVEAAAPSGAESPASAGARSSEPWEPGAPSLRSGLAAAAPEGSARGCAVTVYAGRIELVRGRGAGASRGEYARDVEVYLPGSIWRVRVEPGRRLLDVQASMLPEAVLALGLSLAALLASALALRRRAEEASGIKSRFLANVSREVRNPLNAVLGFTQILLRGQDGPLTAEQEEDLNRVLGGGRRFERLAGQLDDLGRLDSGRVRPASARVSASDLFEEVRGTMAQEAERRGLALGVDGAEGTLRADPSRVRQALVELVDNALRFTPSGGVRLSSRVADGEVVLTVRDTGVGLPPGRRARLFEPFWQSGRPDERRKAEGLGLGLYLARRLVELQGGRIWAEGGPGQGAAFSIALPRAEK